MFVNISKLVTHSKHRAFQHVNAKADLFFWFCNLYGPRTIFANQLLYYNIDIVENNCTSLNLINLNLYFNLALSIARFLHN